MYRVDGYSTSFEGESRDFVVLQVRLRRKLLHIDISPSNFRNSPCTVKEFYKYFKVASSGGDSLDDDLMDQDHKIPATYPETFDYEFGTVDDKLIPGRIQQREIEEAQVLSEFGDDFVHLKGKFQSVHPSQVKICSEYPDDTLDAPDAQPHRVCVDGQTFFFKSADRSSPRDTMSAIKKYLRIADLGPDIRTSRLYGIIEDDKNPLIGLLFYYIDEESTLTFAVEPSTPASLKYQWSTQVTDTLMRLHRAGVMWGDAKAGNVLIDIHSNAWIIDFEGGYTDGWVDRDKEGTAEGDLQRLANIIKFIFDDVAASC